MNLFSAPDEPIKSAPTTFKTPKWLQEKWNPLNLEIDSSKIFRSVSKYQLATYEQLPIHSIQTTAKASKTVDPKGLIFLFNGYGDHCGTMKHVAKYFAHNNFAAFCFDYAGFGQSQGPRGVIENFNHSIRDESVRFVDHIQSVYPQWTGIPRFAFGGSLGGLVAVSIGIHKPNLFRGYLLHAPALELDENIYPILRKLARFIAYYFPTIGLGDPLEDGRPMSTDPNVDIAFKLDPLCFHGSPKAITGVSLIDQFEYFGSGVLEHFVAPFALWHGQNDVIVPINESVRFFKQSHSVDKKFFELSNEMHDLIHGPDHMKYLEAMKSWMEERLNVV